MSNKDPYTHAADAYGNTAGATDQRSLEGKVLLKSARQLEEIAKRLSAEEIVSLEDIGHAIEYNRKLWMVFVNETMNDAHPLPQEIKNNIASLGVFIFKRSTDILADTTPEKINALVEINRNIAAGLMKQQKNAEAKAPEAPPSDSNPTDNLA